MSSLVFKVYVCVIIYTVSFLPIHLYSFLLCHDLNAVSATKLFSEMSHIH